MTCHRCGRELEGERPCAPCLAESHRRYEAAKSVRRRSGHPEYRWPRAVAR